MNIPENIQTPAKESGNGAIADEDDDDDDADGDGDADHRGAEEDGRQQQQQQPLNWVPSSDKGLKIRFMIE